MSDLGEWDDEPEVSDQSSGSPEGGELEAEEAAEPELFYKDLVSFVQEHLSPSYQRSLSGTDRTWCPSWWKHEEGISRLELPFMPMVFQLPWELLSGDAQEVRCYLLVSGTWISSPLTPFLKLPKHGMLTDARCHLASGRTLQAQT